MNGLGDWWVERTVGWRESSNDNWNDTCRTSLGRIVPVVWLLGSVELVLSGRADD